MLLPRMSKGIWRQRFFGYGPKSRTMTDIRSLEQTLLDNPVVSLCAIWHKGESLPHSIYDIYNIFFIYTSEIMEGCPMADDSESMDRRSFLKRAATGAAAGAFPADMHDQDHDHQVVPSDPALRTKALESLLVEKGLEIGRASCRDRGENMGDD